MRRCGRGVEGVFGCLLALLVVLSTRAFKFQGISGLLPHHKKGGQKNVGLGEWAYLLDGTDCEPGTACGEGQWERVAEGGSVLIWKMKIMNSPFVAIKASATMAVSPEVLYETLNPGNPEIVRKYNPMIGEGRDLQRMDKDTKVSWSTSIAMWPTRPRDFVTLIKKIKTSDGATALINKAVEHPDAPPSDEYVRGEIVAGVFLIRPVAGDPRRSAFTMVHHFNPGGHIPAWLMNWLAEMKPISFVQRLEATAQELAQQRIGGRGRRGSGGRGGRRQRECAPNSSVAGPPNCGSLSGNGVIWRIWESRGSTTALAVMVLAALLVAVCSKRRGRTWESCCRVVRVASSHMVGDTTGADLATCPPEKAAAVFGEEQNGKLSSNGALADGVAALNNVSAVNGAAEVNGIYANGTVPHAIGVVANGGGVAKDFTANDTAGAAAEEAGAAAVVARRKWKGGSSGDDAADGRATRSQGSQGL